MKLNKTEVLNRRRRSFNRLVERGYVGTVDTAKLYRSDDNLRIGIILENASAPKSRRGIMRPISRRGLIELDD